MEPQNKMELNSLTSPPCISNVLFVGDSITLHSPKPSIGWTGNWGMAASSESRDYVHRFYQRLCEALSPSAAPKLIVSGRIAGTETAAGRIDGHLSCIDRYLAIPADLIVVQLGENETNAEVNVESFEKPYQRLVEALLGDHRPLLLCTGVWGKGASNELRNQMIQDVCLRTGATYVSIESVCRQFATTSAQSLFPHEGVAWHPGDLGHQGYADALWHATETSLNQGKHRLNN